MTTAAVAKTTMTCVKVSQRLGNNPSATCPKLSERSQDDKGATRRKEEIARINFFFVVIIPGLPVVRQL